MFTVKLIFLLNLISLLVNLLQMEEEMNELKRQRDLAQSQLELERRSKKELKVQKNVEFRQNT